MSFNHVCPFCQKNVHPEHSTCQTQGCYLFGKVIAQPASTKAPPAITKPKLSFSDDTTTTPWWLTMSPEKADGVIAKRAKETEAAQAAQAAIQSPPKAPAPMETKVEEEPKKPLLTPLHAMFFAMLINDEAAAQGDNGWTGWVAKPREEDAKPIVRPPLPPLSPSKFKNKKPAASNPVP